VEALPSPGGIGRLQRQFARLCPQGFQRIKESRVMPVFSGAELAAATASQLSLGEMRPAPAGDIKVGEMGDQQGCHHAPVAVPVG